MEVLKTIALLCQVLTVGATPESVMAKQRACHRELIECIQGYTDSSVYNRDEWKLTQCLRDPKKRVR